MPMICFHGTPFSGSPYDILPFFEGRNFLISVEYQTYKTLLKPVAKKIILDNGAFTIWKKGRGEVDLIRYSDFVQEFDSLENYGWCFIPDIIQGDEYSNDKMLEKWLNIYGEYKGTPVWHYHESLNRLKELCKTFSVVGLGSSAEYSKIGDDKWMSRTKEIFEFVANNNLSTKLHGLRMLNKRIFTKFPYYSGDSTNVGRNIEFYKARHHCKTRLEAAEKLARSFESYSSTYDYSSEMADSLNNRT
jgi:hypothetical protein